MYQKKFVSIYFSSNKVQIAKLNSTKSSVVKFASYGLPQGAIANHKVQNTKLLTETIKGIWKQMNIKEKSVGIIVPEFSTFTKTLTLPNLGHSDLDEAVRWQASEILPFEKGSEILDWKIVERKENECQILISAISKDVLTGYVDAVSGSGLYPLSVETPSLSLVRVTNGENKKRLIIYQGEAETILLISHGQSIVGSSVVASKDENVVLYTAFQIVHHYSGGSVEEVYMGGINYSQSFYEQLRSQLGAIPLKQAGIPIQGLNPAELQEYLVPLSMQMQDPQSPDDELTINLLPPAWAKHYQDELIKSQAWKLSIIANILIALNLAAVLFAFVYLSAQHSSVLANSSQGTTVDQSVIDRVKEVNQLTERLSNIAESELYPQTMINALSSKDQTGITINYYKVDLEKGTAEVRGHAVLRNDLINYRNMLQESGMFESVQIPISNLVAEENIEFNITLQKEVVKQKQAVPKLKL